MSEQDHDRLEEFFRKASVRPEVPFNEDDWKKLEARLDAADLSAVSNVKKVGGKMISAMVAGVILLFVGGVWVGSRYELGDLQSNDAASELSNQGRAITESTDNQPYGPAENTASEKDAASQIGDGKPESSATEKISDPQASVETERYVKDILTDRAPNESLSRTGDADDAVANENPAVKEGKILSDAPAKTTTLHDGKVFGDLISMSTANAEKIKQRANVDLPGAEEGDTGEANAIVTEEDASVKRVVTPRLSLLLSFAPDFSSTSNQYAAPGKAFGAMIQYHFLKKWSLSVGVIKNNKKYTGDGEDYQPPKGYWKYYTNGIVPYSIDGACTVLEFPLMLQYTIATNGKNRWLAGAGTSSYVMLDESYHYYFDRPNPGANDGWESRSSSKFFMNMLNFTVGYERQVFPGLMIGIEPYVKVPLEAIGWSNIRLFSTGASFTLRYKFSGKMSNPLPVYSRGPD